MKAVMKMPVMEQIGELVDKAKYEGEAIDHIQLTYREVQQLWREWSKNGMLALTEPSLPQFIQRVSSGEVYAYGVRLSCEG